VDRELIASALAKPPSSIAYEVSRLLSEKAAGRAVIETATSLDVMGFARAGHAKAVLADGVHSEVVTDWEGPDEGLRDQPVNAWLEVSCGEARLEVLLIRWLEGFQRETRAYLVADDEEVARQFLARCAAWSAEVHGEILVFSDGCFQKSARLHREIRSASWDDLILHGDLRRSIADDFAHFFAARATYERLGAAWRRGALFLGPPGNGKTLCVKALVNRLAKPTIYVRGFRHRYRTMADCIADVFTRARQIAPCVLVLEDIDGLFDPEGLAFFLNELDGFAENAGIVTLGTTNHPDRLDPALLDRPSRFDRTYAFELPRVDERQRYLELRNERLVAEQRLSPEVIRELSEATDGFSFAYMKELVLGALLASVDGPVDLAPALRAGLARLREQLGRAREIAAGSGRAR
jgi:hypothetical protein